MATNFTTDRFSVDIRGNVTTNLIASKNIMFLDGIIIFIIISSSNCNYCQFRLFCFMQSTLTGSITSFYVSGGDGYVGSMSGTGKYLVGRRNAGQSNGQVAISSDYGASSTIQSFIFHYSSAVQVSVTGQYILVSINGYGQYAVYLSSDYGSTWTNHGLACYWTPAPNLAISSTGQYMAAGSNNYAGSTCGASGYFSVSSDYGVTWTRRSATLCWQRIVFVSVSTSAASSGVMIVAIGNVFTSGTTSCSSTMNVMSSLDLGVTWTVLSSTTLTPSLPAVPGGVVGSIKVFYKAISSDVAYTFATITASTTTLQGTYGCPYLPTSASSNGQVYVAIDSAGNLRISNLKRSNSLTSWSPAISPASLTACTNALLTGDGMSVTAFCGTNVYRTTIIDHSPTMQPSGRPSQQPSSSPTKQPSGQPSFQPSRQPSRRPSGNKSPLPFLPIVMSYPSLPSINLTPVDTGQPSQQPSVQPTMQPSGILFLRFYVKSNLSYLQSYSLFCYLSLTLILLHRTT